MTRPTMSMVRDLAKDALDSIPEAEQDNDQAVVTVRGDQLIDVLEDYIRMRAQDDPQWMVS